jgi:class 3 adenylate cyclase
MSASTPAEGPSPGQRTLAAIVFTDVVSFSARMHADEMGTLKLLQRDFGEMRRICAAHEGAVLKTTGDGLLLTFTSAVQAVACALAMQRQFAAEAKSLAAGQALQHRIGIHLGDVLVKDEDVMGDGVNIASRLQAEAEPGGICISQTVYDVVRNKLEMKVVSLGARELKNIAQAMPVYSLLLEAQALDPSAGLPAPAPRRMSAAGRRRLLIFAGLAVALAAIFAGGLFLGRRAPSVPAAPAAAAPTGAPVATSGPAPATGAEAATGDLASDLASEYAKRRDVMQELHAKYLDKYDFNGLVLALRDQAEKPGAPAGLQQLLRAGEQLVRLKDWLEVNLRRYSQQHPLSVHNLSGDPAKDFGAYLASDLRLVLLEKTGPQPHDWAELKPATVGAIVVSALHESKAGQRAAVVGAQAFARLYSLPAMTEALAPDRVRREKDPAKPSAGHDSSP